MGPTASGGLAPGRRELNRPYKGKGDLVSRNGTPGIASTISGMFGGEKKSQE